MRVAIILSNGVASGFLSTSSTATPTSAANASARPLTSAENIEAAANSGSAIKALWVRFIAECRSAPSLACWPAVDQIEKERVDLLWIPRSVLGQRTRCLVERERRQVVHPHRIENAVEMVALVLQKGRPGAVRLLFDGGALDRLVANRDPRKTRHLPMQPRNRQAPLPDRDLLLAYRRNLRIDHHGPVDRPEVRSRRNPRRTDAVADDTPLDEPLRRGDSARADFLESLAHVSREARDLRVGRIVDSRGDPPQDRMPHFRYRQNGHESAPASVHLGGRLLRRHRIACYRGTPHVARLALVEPADAMHCLPIVPDDEVVLPPDVRIDELALRRVLGPLAEQVTCFRYLPTNDGADM